MCLCLPSLSHLNRTDLFAGTEHKGITQLGLGPASAFAWLILTQNASPWTIRLVYLLIQEAPYPRALGDAPRRSSP